MKTGETPHSMMTKPIVSAADASLLSAQHPHAVGYESPSRRALLGHFGAGLGLVGLATILGDAQAAAQTKVDWPLAPRPSQFPTRVKHVIHIYLNGGP